MDDDRMDLLLREAGEDFRATHTRPAVVRTAPATTHRRWLLPAGAAAAAAALVVGLAVTLPEGSSRTTPAAPVSVPLGMGQVGAVELGADWVAVAGRDLTSPPTQDRIEVRRRADLGEVADTVRTTYESAVLLCPALDGDTLLWTEVQAGDLTAGAARQWSLWERDLRARDTRRLEAGTTSDARPSVPCPVAGERWAAWSSDGQLSVRDLSSGYTYARPDKVVPVAITPAGLIAKHEGTGRLAGRLDVLRYTGPTYGTRRPLVTVPSGIDLAASGDRLVVIAPKQRGVQKVTTCTLPRCEGWTEISHGAALTWPTVGEGFAAWSGSGGPFVVRFDSGPVPATVPGLVPNESLSAFGDTLAYVVAGFPPTLHLLPVTDSP